MNRPLLGVAVALAGLVALSGCTPTVSMTPSPAATDPACAAVVVRLPQSLGAAQRRETDAQGTAAWGDPPAVTLSCGVTPPGPTTDFCVSIGGVDWIERDLPNAQHPVQYVLRTYGRTPATQVVIEAKRISSADVLPALSDAVVAAIPTASRHCAAAPSPSVSP
ncbi:MAG: hypothetical protein QOC59_1065 [Microbacteriaceae bacterium]|nr:hypothetical protein [Microbacteriaceae bacterium]